MYGLNCKYYTKTFKNLDDLVQDIIERGMDPNYEIYQDNQPTGQLVIDFIQE